MLKVNGYPDAEYMRWNPVAVFIRSWGWLALFLPALWFGISLFFSKKRGDYDLSLCHVWTLILLTGGMMAFYVWTALTAGIFHSTRIQTAAQHQEIEQDMVGNRLQLSDSLRSGQSSAQLPTL